MSEVMSMAELRRREYLMAGMTPPSEKLSNNSETPGASSAVAPKLAARLESTVGNGYYIVFTAEEQSVRVKLSIGEFEDLLNLGLEVDIPKSVW